MAPNSAKLPELLREPRSTTTRMPTPGRHGSLNMLASGGKPRATSEGIVLAASAPGGSFFQFGVSLALSVFRPQLMIRTDSLRNSKG